MMNATLLNTRMIEGSRRLLWMALAILILLAPAAQVLAQSGQYGGQNFPQPNRPGQDSMSPLGDDVNSAMEAKRINALNAERQKSLISDTVKLVKLVSDLNAEINGEHPASLTDEQIKKLAEIEKLAHNIREKMSSSINGSPRINAPASIIPPVMQ
jgi:hypothetical protein